MTSSNNPNTICAIIPFFNEEKHLKNLINDVLSFVDFLILVNDGSTDNSTSLIPKDERIYLISNHTNSGKGKALRIGFEKSISLNTLYTITLDADYQHDPSIIPIFIESLKQYDCVIGKRNRAGTKMPYHRRLSNLITSKLLSFKTGVKILDSQSGYRGFRTNILKNVLPEYSGFEAESEMIVKICRNNYSLSFVDIQTIYGDDNSKMKAIPAIKGFLKVILKT